MTQPNELVETIEKALDAWEHNGYLIANAPEWLRALLEEVKKLRDDLTELNRSFGALEYANIDNLNELQQTREENERLKSFVEYAAKGLPGIVRKARETLSIYPPRREEDET